MKKFFKSFMILWIILGVMLLVFFCATSVRNWTGKKYTRENDVCTDEQRVFDEAGVLSNSEE